MRLKNYEMTSLGPAQIAVVNMVSRGTKILEVGCAAGYMTRYLAQELSCKVTVVELNAEQAEQASQYAERVIIGDICDPVIRNQIPQSFDHIIYADVLEHLVDPWEVLSWTKSLLSDTGTVIASIPNVAYYKIRKSLLLGRFDYTDYGILDNTHLRFFTERTCKELFQSSGYKIGKTVNIYRGKTDKRLCWLAPNAFTYQFVVSASLLREIAK